MLQSQRIKKLGTKSTADVKQELGQILTNLKKLQTGAGKSTVTINTIAKKATPIYFELKGSKNMTAQNTKDLRTYSPIIFSTQALANSTTDDITTKIKYVNSLIDQAGSYA